MKIFLDTNILLDVITKREPFVKDSSKLWSLIKEKFFEGYISTLSINNIYYIVRKLSNMGNAELAVDEILKDFSTISLTTSLIKKARTSPKKDLEDLIQYYSAIQENCDFLVTRNEKDYPSGGIRIINPTKFLDHMYNKFGKEE